MMRASGSRSIAMNPLLPPSRERFRQNLRLLAADWKAGGAQRRYFIASQVLSAILLGACSLASIAAGIAGLTATHLMLLGAAAACLVHSLSSWHVLKRRFRVRYEIW